MYKNFEKYMWGIMGLHGSWEKMVYNLTEQLIELKNTPNLKEIMKINPTKLVPGRFYLIQYDFNGNPIWCPILALEYKIHKNNHILYSLNLEYLPPRYKMLFFNQIFKKVYNELNLIANKEFVKEEQPMKFMNFEFIYKMLKSNGNMDWAITAYTIINFVGKVKIKQAYLCSIKILPQIIFSDFKRYNMKNMIKLQQNLNDDDGIKMKQIINEYQVLLENYQADSILYHKTVALFREKLKLFKN
jgi:hypothetical protein